MKNPNSAGGAGAFRVTSTATVASPVDATCGTVHASPEARFYWDRLSNSVQPLELRKGRLRRD